MKLSGLNIYLWSFSSSNLKLFILSCFQTLQKMMGVRWDIRDIMSQHNAYVDMLVRVMQHTPYF